MFILLLKSHISILFHCNRVCGFHTDWREITCVGIITEHSGIKMWKYFSLNRNWKKSNVIKMKIMKFYLSREENKASLNDLALGALVNVIALTVPVKASAVYNILRSFPNLFVNNR